MSGIISLQIYGYGEIYRVQRQLVPLQQCLARNVKSCIIETPA